MVEDPLRKHEVLHGAYLLIEMLQISCGPDFYPILHRDKTFAQAYEAAEKALSDLYQAAGALNAEEDR